MIECGVAVLVVLGSMLLILHIQFEFHYIASLSHPIEVTDGFRRDLVVWSGGATCTREDESFGNHHYPYLLDSTLISQLEPSLPQSHHPETDHDTTG